MAGKTFRELVKEANLNGWMILNLFQLSANRWRCNMQRKTENGGSEAVFTEFAEGASAEEAIEANLFNMAQKRPKAAPHALKPETLTPDQNRRITAALDTLKDALDAARTRGSSREDDL